MNSLNGKPNPFNLVFVFVFRVRIYLHTYLFGFVSRHVSEYLKVQERDPKAHKFLGQLYEKEGEVDKAVGCYKVCNRI